MRRAARPRDVLRCVPTGDERASRRHGALERAIEARRERIAPEDLDPARVREHDRVRRRRADERAQRLGVAVHDMRPVDDHRRRRAAADGRRATRRSRLLPPSVDARRRPRERVASSSPSGGPARGSSFADFRSVVGDRQQKRAKAPRAGGDACLGYGAVESERAPRFPHRVAPDRRRNQSNAQSPPARPRSRPRRASSAAACSDATGTRRH